MPRELRCRYPKKHLASFLPESLRTEMTWVKGTKQRRPEGQEYLDREDVAQWLHFSGPILKEGRSRPVPISPSGCPSLTSVHGKLLFVTTSSCLRCIWNFQSQFDPREFMTSINIGAGQHCLLFFLWQYVLFHGASWVLWRSLSTWQSEFHTHHFCLVLLSKAGTP